MKWIAIKDQLPPYTLDDLPLWNGEFVIGYMLSSGRFYSSDEKRLIEPTHWAEITPPEIGEAK